MKSFIYIWHKVSFNDCCLHFTRVNTLAQQELAQLIVRFVKPPRAICWLPQSHLPGVRAGAPGLQPLPALLSQGQGCRVGDPPWAQRDLPGHRETLPSATMKPWLELCKMLTSISYLPWWCWWGAAATAATKWQMATKIFFQIFLNK